MIIGPRPDRKAKGPPAYDGGTGVTKFLKAHGLDRYEVWGPYFVLYRTVCCSGRLNSRIGCRGARDVFR